MLRAWRIAHRGPFPPTCVRAWKGLDLLALFRTLDRMDLALQEKPQGRLRQLLERDADYAEALGALDQPEGSLDRRALLRDTFTALDQLPLVYCPTNN